MIDLLIIVICLVIIGIITGWISYTVGFFGIIPVELMALMLFTIALNIVLFVIHRKD